MGGLLYPLFTHISLAAQSKKSVQTLWVVIYWLVRWVVGWLFVWIVSWLRGWWDSQLVQC